MEYCCKCGKPISTENGQIFCAFEMSVDIAEASPEIKDLAERQMGEYQFGKRYRFCYSCFLGALGAKP